MGTQQVKLEVYGSVSRHNSDKDRQHDSLWEELRHRVEMIVREHRYEEISPQVL